MADDRTPPLDLENFEAFISFAEYEITCCACGETNEFDYVGSELEAACIGCGHQICDDCSVDEPADHGRRSKLKRFFFR